MRAAAGWPTRLRGLVVLAAFVAAGVALAGPPPDGYLHGSIYPWWVWILVVVGGLAGLTWVLVSFGILGPTLTTVAASVTFVVGAELAGTGIVAWEHWENARNQSGYGYGQRPAL